MARAITNSKQKAARREGLQGVPSADTPFPLGSVLDGSVPSPAPADLTWPSGEPVSEREARGAPGLPLRHALHVRRQRPSLPCDGHTEKERVPERAWAWTPPDVKYEQHLQ